MGNKYHYGIYGLAFAALVLLISAPVAGTPTVDSINLNILSTEPSMEFLQVIPGKGAAVLSNIYSFGATTSLAGDSEPGLAEARSWLVLYSNQGDYDDYLNRIPIESPDGLAVYLTYEASSSSFDSAADAKAYFEGLYGISLGLLQADATGSEIHRYSFFAESDTALFGNVASDVEAISSDGFNSLMDASRITGAPVAWAGYGVKTFDSGNRVSVNGVGFVDPNGITSTAISGGFEHTLSTQNLFGESVQPVSSPSFGLSRVSISFPYPISPSSITPTTTNPLPHVTGQMVWDVRHPAYNAATNNGNYEVKFEVGLDPAFPLVNNELSINKTKLDVDGDLEVVFDLTNTGGEDASNVMINFPLGPDFQRISQQNITIYRVNPLYEINPLFESRYNVKLTVGGVEQFNYEAFVLTGWYDEVATSNPAIWTGLGASNTVLYDQTYNVLGTDINIKLEFSSTNGLPVPLDDLITSQLIPALVGVTPSASAASEIIGEVKSNLKPMLKSTFNSSFNTLYEAVDSFNFDSGSFSLVSEEVVVGPASSRTEWFLRATIPTLAKNGGTAQLSFSLNDIPVKSDKLAFMQFVPGETPEGYPTAQLISEESNYNEVIQYMFQVVGFDGRPISFELPDDFNLEFNGFNSAVYGSMGAAFTWENTKGFQFFGLSNGLNLQFADDEAMVKASVSLDSQTYQPGDTKTITIELENLGNLPAENVKVHVLHTSLGKDWQLFERIERIAVMEVGTLAAGAKTTVTVQTDANSFLGYSPVFALVEFDSDVGQDPSLATVPDFLDLYPGDEIAYEAAGQTHQIVMSTLSGALLLPATDDQVPSIPEARLDVSVSNEGDTVTYRITNIGSAPTDISFAQQYDNEVLSTSESDVVAPTGADVVVVNAAGIVAIDEISIGVGELVEIKVTYKNPTGAVVALRPAIIEFTMDGESSLGTSIDLGGGSVGPSSALGLLASAAAQQQSQQAATEDSTSAAFSASSSVGASIDVGVDTSTKTIGKGSGGFIGISVPETFGLMLGAVTVLSILRRRRN